MCSYEEEQTPDLSPLSLALISGHNEKKADVCKPGREVSHTPTLMAL